MDISLEEERQFVVAGGEWVGFGRGGVGKGSILMILLLLLGSILTQHVYTAIVKCYTKICY